MKGMALIAPILVVLSLSSCGKDRARPSPAVVRRERPSSAPIEMSMSSPVPDGAPVAKASPPSLSRRRAKSSPAASSAASGNPSPLPSGRGAPASSMRPAGSPPALPDPADLVPPKSPKTTQVPSARLPASGPFALLPIGVSDYRYPEDFSLGPLEPRPAGAIASSDPGVLAYALAKALVNKAGVDALAAPGRATVIAQALRPYLSSKAAISGYRIGKLRRDVDSAECRAFFFNESGGRIVAEFYFTKTLGSWGVDGVAGDFASIAEASPAPRSSFDPGEYEIFSY